MNRFIGEIYNSRHLDPFLDEIREKIMDRAADDLYRTFDYGYSYADFYNSFELAAGAHVRLGIKPFISTRTASAQDQLDVNPIDPIITLLYVNNPSYTEAAEIEFLVEDDGSIENVKIWCSTKNDFYEWILSDKGNGLYSSLNIKVAEIIDMSFRIIDVSGRIVQEGELLDSMTVISFNKHLVNGLYLIEIRSNDDNRIISVLSKRFIISR
jgi:hypothetical protein